MREVVETSGREVGYVIDASAGRPSSRRRHELRDGTVGPPCCDLDMAVRSVPHPSGDDPRLDRGLPNEPAESDTLHLACDFEMDGRQRLPSAAAETPSSKERGEQRRQDSGV